MVVQTVSKPIDALLSTTMERVKPVMADNIFKGHPELAKLYDKRQTATGVTLEEPVMYGLNSTAKWATSDYDTFDTTPQEGMTWAHYVWRKLFLTTVISGSERAKNSGPEAVLNLWKQKVKQTTMTARETLSEEIGIINTSKDPAALLGLDDIVADVTTFAGNSLGGIDAGTNTWWQNQTLDAAAGGIGNSLSVFLARLYSRCNEGTEKPDLIVTAKDVYAHIEGLMSGIQRITSKEFDDLGFENIAYKTSAIVPDFYIQAERLYMLNTNWLTLYVLKGRDMSGGEVLEVANQDVFVSKMIWEGQLTTNNRRYHGVNITTALTTELTRWGQAA